MIPYGKHEVTEGDRRAVLRVLDSERLTQGNEIPRFESALENRFGCDHAVLVGSGTLALQITYDALGIESGDEVLTTPLSFVATTNGFLHRGARPRFVDIDPETYNLSLRATKEFLGDSTNRGNLKALVVVHFAGLPAPVGEFAALAEEHGLHLVEDACHAPGARWRDGGGSWHGVGRADASDAAVLSFHPVKHITSGEGGALLTDDSELAARARRLRTHGINYEPDPPGAQPWYYEMQSLGYNGRITDIQAALGRSQLERLDEYLEKRRERARRYDEQFEDVDEIDPQSVPPDREHAYHLYVVRVPERDRLFRVLKQNGIAPQVHYLPIHRHPYYRNRFEFESGDFPEAESYYEEAISLPLFPSLDRSNQQRVINVVKSFYGRS